jgi:transposase-like protein
MVAYPADQLEFEDWFSTEEKCRDFIWNLRFSGGFVCRSCGHNEYWKQSRGRMTCKACRDESSLLVGTVFEGSRLSLMLWFRAGWWVIGQKNGVSAVGLQAAMGIGSYETAWLLLHKLRQAMIRPHRERLKGSLEVDEAIIGGRRSGALGRDPTGNPLVVIAVEEEGKRMGRIRMKLIPDATAKSLEAFVQENVEKGSQITTDLWRSYSRLADLGYEHRKVAAYKIKDEEILPRVHLVTALLKRWLLGTHQGRVERKHLQAYLDEFVFRFNRRTSSSRGLLFLRLMEGAISQPTISYPALIKRAPPLHPGKHNL